jgi:hypothetical protein
MENRAAVFTKSSQAVEVQRSGAWWPGELLGWRHGDDGACQVWVRVRTGGAEQVLWTDLLAVRLPEQSAPAAVGATRERVRATVEPGRDPMTATIRCHAVRDTGAPAPDGALRAGGRRRAPETVEDGRTPPAPRVAAPAVTPGRHRAPAAAVVAAGRHRAADTGVLPVVAVVPEPAGPVEGDGEFHTRPLRLSASATQRRTGRPAVPPARV